MISRRSFVKTSVLGSAAAIASRTPLLNSAIPQPAEARSTRFGVNFVPRKRWWYCWLDWDQQAIEDDLSGVAELGMDHIRIQCLWPFFQPGIGTVSDRALANLHSLLDAADKAGLDVEVTVLDGWMSGLSFLPAWVAPLVNPGDTTVGNIFTSSAIIEAEKLLLRRIAETVGGHRRFLGFDLGNELGVLQNPNNNPVSTKNADVWATEMLRYCDEIAPKKFHVNGIDHAHWFGDVGFSREEIATTGHASVVHSYIYFDGVLDHYKYSDPASLHLAEYEIELAYAYHTDLSRRVWVEETGVGSTEMPESYKPEFMEHSVRNILSTDKAWGITWWCSHDIDPAVKGFDSAEYVMGLLDLKNKPKPMGRKFAELAAESRRTSPVKAPRKVALVIPDHGLSTKPWPADWRYATPYMNLIARGETPAIVLESRSKDADYLKARGISTLIPCSC
jgi:endo-1,4-beta-mannosidase